MKRKRDDDDGEGKLTVSIQWPPAQSVSTAPEPPAPVALAGRPDFTSAAKKIKLIRDSDYLEDRRHLVHWAEHLRPILAEVFSALVLEKRTPTALLPFLNQKIAAFNANHGTLARDRRLHAQKATTGDVEKLILFIAGRVNAMVENLVPDRADINVAIEHVRADVRRYRTEVEKHEVQALNSDKQRSVTARVAEYLGLAETLFEQKLAIQDRSANLTRVYTRQDDSAMMDRRKEINSLILEHIKSCRSPADLVILLQNIEHSVTFDLSAKAQREQTAHALAWLNQMRTNRGKTAEQRFDDMLAFIR